MSRRRPIAVIVVPGLYLLAPIVLVLVGELVQPRNFGKTPQERTHNVPVVAR